MFAFGCRNSFRIVMPASDCDSMCSMSLTVVVKLRSLTDVIRLAMSSADRPVYDQIMLTTGILISGSTSTGVVNSTNGVASKIRIAITMNVYGRLSATLTIHIETRLRGCRWGDGKSALMLD